MLEDYYRAKKQGDREWRKAASEGRYPYLPALDDMVEDIASLNEVPVGLIEIPIEMIAGTKTAGRQNAFSAGYMPILGEKTEFGLKWSKLYDAQLEEGIRDPIKVYEYMRRFYVEEGNKRVSVLKYLHVPTVLGDVIRILPRPSDDKSYRIYKEFQAFYAVAPLYMISFSEEGRYEKLAALMGRDLKTRWPDETVETLRSSYRYFEKIYLGRGGDHLPITVGDALLVYLSIYSADSLLSESSAVLKQRVGRIWPEFLVKTGGDHVQLVEEPAPEDESRQKPAVTGLIGSLLKRGPGYSAERPLRAAFLYDRSPEESSWDYSHELGRTALEESFEGLVETVRFDHCSHDEQISRAIEAAAADEENVVFTVTPSQLPQTLRSAVEHPDIRFLNCSVNYTSNAVRTYYGRMYEAKFLMGALAASVADGHKIGYLAGAPLYGEIADINAFAIGAAIVDPSAKIFLSWSSQEEDWKQKIKDEGIRVQSGPNLLKPQEEGREFGLYSIHEDGSVLNLAMPVWNWRRYYELILNSILNGTWDDKRDSGERKALNYWFGMSSGVIDVIMSDRISYYSRKLVGILKQAVIADTLSPFDGEIRSQGGLIKTVDDPRLSNESVITMDWLNDNVIGHVPEISEITDDVDKKSVKVSGVPESLKLQ